MKTPEENIKYFIEHKETKLWWYYDEDKSRPNHITTFRGDRIKGIGFMHKDGWTNDPNDERIWFNSKEEAQKAIDRDVLLYPESVEITEHIFYDKEYATSQIEDLTSELSELKESHEGIKKTNVECHEYAKKLQGQVEDITKEVRLLKEKEIRGDRMIVDLEHEKTVLKSSNDRYREALEEKVEQLKYCHGRMAEAYKEATDAQQTKNDLTGCTQLLNEMFKWAKVKDGRAIFETSEETWNGYKKFVSALHPLVKEGE